MSRVPPRMQNLARRLIAQEARETGESKSSSAGLRADFSVLEKLRPKLTTLMGQGGFHALVSRARALAGADIPRLHDVRITADGSLEGWDEIAAQGGSKGLSEAKAALLAQLLGLLQAFIGEILTRQLVIEAWPRLSLDDLDSDRGAHGEKQA